MMENDGSLGASLLGDAAGDARMLLLSFAFERWRGSGRAMPF